MGKDLFEIGKAITKGAFDGSTFWQVMLIVIILVSGMLIKLLLEKIKYTHPKLTITILVLLFSFAISLAIRQFAGDDKKKTITESEEVKYQTDYPNTEYDSIAPASQIDSAN